MVADAGTENARKRGRNARELSAADGQRRIARGCIAASGDSTSSRSASTRSSAPAVFALPAGLAINAGRYSLAVIFVAFVVVGLLALSLAEVASRYDVTGGPAVLRTGTFGPLAGFTVGWLFTLSSIASTALIAQVMLDYAAALWPALAAPWPRAVVITAFIILLAGINIRGVTRGAGVGNLLTIAKMLPLGLIALAGLWFAGWNDIPATEPRQPDGLANALQIAIFACVGFDVAAVVAGEMRDPRRDLSISILGGLAIACLLYLLLMLACFGVLPDTAASKLPLVDVAKSFVGPAGATLMATAAVVSCAGGLSVQMLVGPRYVFALGEARDLPHRIIDVHDRFHTPHVAIIAYAATLMAADDHRHVQVPAGHLRDRPHACPRLDCSGAHRAAAPRGPRSRAHSRAEASSPCSPSSPAPPSWRRPRCKAVRDVVIVLVGRASRSAAARTLAHQEHSMKRREFLAAGASLAAFAPLPGWTAVLKGVGDLAAKSLDGAEHRPARVVGRGPRRAACAATCCSPATRTTTGRAVSGTGCSTSIPR